MAEDNMPEDKQRRQIESGDSSKGTIYRPLPKELEEAPKKTLFEKLREEEPPRDSEDTDFIPTVNLPPVNVRDLYEK